MCGLIMGLQSMIKSASIFLLVLPLTLALWDPNWALYRWQGTAEDAMLLPSEKQLLFSHPSLAKYMRVISTAPIQQLYNSYNISSFSVSDSKCNMVIQTLGEELRVKLTDCSLLFQVGCLGEECSPGAAESLEKTFEHLKKDTNFKKHCKMIKEFNENNHKGELQCKVSGSAIIPMTASTNSSNAEEIIEQEIGFFEQKITEFMKINDLDPSSKGDFSLVRTALSELVSSICLFQQDQRRYLGFCDQKGYNFKLAAYPIEILADYDFQLGAAIFRDYSSLLENRVLYPLDEHTVGFPLPERIDVFARYTPPFMPFRQTEILKSLFVMPMLSQLGTLHEELNYREAKKLHPFLIQMLTQKWKANSPIQAAKSIYSESFTEDFKHHEYGDQLEQSVTKNNWIFKVIDTFNMILIKYYAAYMEVQQIKEHMQEHFTLLNIYKAYLGDDDNAQAGKFMDIVSTNQGAKFYSKTMGYGSILPFIYRDNSVYPFEAMSELASPYGLKSSNGKYEPNRRYRGDIHSYFNCVILTGIAKKLKDSDQSQLKKKIIENVNNIGKNVAKFIRETFAGKKQIFTSWSPEGVGKEQVPWLKITAALMLKWK